MSRSSFIPGPFRAASKPGVFITMIEFRDIYGEVRALSNDSVKDIRERGVCGGYTFSIDCHLFKNNSGAVTVRFDFRLEGGKWNNYVEWPFHKMVTVIITHLRDQGKDVRVPIKVDDYSKKKKPAADSSSDWCYSERVSWDLIEFNGFVTNNTLYVNVEFE